jgi:uncharacterized protein (DUF697 family)
MRRKLPSVIPVEKPQNDERSRSYSFDDPPPLIENGRPEQGTVAEFSTITVQQTNARKVPNEAVRQHAVKLVERFAFWSGAAGALPIPVVDLAGVAAVQLQMIRRLADLYDVDFSPELAKALLASIGGAVLAGSSGLGAASLTKALPVIGPLISSTAVPTLAAGATLATGFAFIEHFASGGTLLNFPSMGNAGGAQSSRPVQVTGD